MTSQRRAALRPYALGVAAVALFAFLMSMLVSQRVFERLPHLEDEMAYLFQARVFAGGHVVVDIPQQRRAFWQPFVIDYQPTGKRFGKYPPGWPALLAVGVLLGWPWLINAAFAAATIPLVLLLGRDLFNDDVGLIAAVLTAFSPSALLLSGTLMPHTSSLFLATLFLWSCWRCAHSGRPCRWGALGGLALGTLFAIRPLTAAAVAAPCAVWSAAVALRPPLSDLRRLRAALRPWLLLTTVALCVAASVPLFNLAATGDATENLYTLVWPYDRVGFGEGHGRSGHSIATGLRNARFDLSLASADLFGWQLDPLTPELRRRLVTVGGRWPARAYSFVLLPIALVMGLFPRSRRGHRLLALSAVWLVGSALWIAAPSPLVQDTFAPIDWQSPFGSWLWVAVALVWLLAPLPLLSRGRDRSSAPQVWLLAAVIVGLVLVHTTYWAGAQRYSARYYFEGLAAASLLSAIPLSWLASRWSRPVTYALVSALAIVGLFHYSLPRVTTLHRFNSIGSDLVNLVKARHAAPERLLVIVSGPASGEDRVRWQSYGALMAMTSPYLDSEIVAARDRGGDARAELGGMFPDRQVIVMRARGREIWFATEEGER